MYIPDANDIQHASSQNNHDAHKLFLLTRKNEAEIFSLNLLQANYDCSVELDAEKLKIGHLAIREHTSTILTAAFSPDGSAITTSSLDGEVNLFKISFDSSNEASANENDVSDNERNENKIILPKCLKKWYPHGQKPVNSLYFLDDHKNSQPDDTFWSHLITGNF